MKKLFVFTGLYFFSIITNAVLCPANERSVDEIFEGANGIYLVTLVGTNNSN